MEEDKYFGCERNECKKCKEPKRKNCLSIIFAILVFALAVSLGLILGAVFASTILEALSAIIVFAVVAALLLIINIIKLLCNKK